ncbi:hypothetical protein [Actinopolymorpha pittospori]
MTSAAGTPEARFEAARAVAEAVLYDGYVLQPERPSRRPNAERSRFGVLVPLDYSPSDASERTFNQTECLLEGEHPQLSVRVRFLHLQRCDVESAFGTGFVSAEALAVGATTYLPRDEAVEAEVSVQAAVTDLLRAPAEVRFRRPASQEYVLIAGSPGAPGPDPVGRLVRERQAVEGVVQLAAEPLHGPYGVTRIRVRVENRTQVGARTNMERPEALAHALAATHVLLSATDGTFVSMLAPPDWAEGYVDRCDNIGIFPVLVGEPDRADMMLSSPIILHDHARLVPEEASGRTDSTGIERLLGVPTMSLTEAPLAAALEVDAPNTTEGRAERHATAPFSHVSAMPPDVLERLHGAVHFLSEVPQAPTWGARPHAGSPAAELDEVVIAGAVVRKGSRVHLRPSRPRPGGLAEVAEAGRTATVVAVFLDVDGSHRLAVVPDRDGVGRARSRGAYLYLSPEEIEPFEATP